MWKEMLKTGQTKMKLFDLHAKPYIWSETNSAIHSEYIILIVK